MITVENIAFIAVFGAVNYWICNVFDIFSFFDKNEKDEKYSFWIVLGVLNLIILDLFMYTKARHWYYPAVVFISVISSVLFILMIFKCLQCISKLVGSERNVFFRSVFMEEILSRPKRMVYCHIFDFEGNLIEHGWMHRFSSDNKDDFAMTFKFASFEKNEKSQLDINFKEFRDEVALKEDCILYLDFDRKIKVYIEFVNEK